MPVSLRILVVDDNRSSADALARILRKQGHDVVALYDGRAAIERMNAESYGLILTDLKMEPVDGMQVLRAARAHQPPIEVIVFTAFGAVERAVEAMQLGARDFLTKPVSVDQILDRVRQITGDPEPAVGPNAPMIAYSASARRLLSTLQAVADVPSPVWLEGELGSGRRHAARLLHDFGTGERAFTVIDPTSDDRWPGEGTLALIGVDELDDAAQQALVRRVQSAPPALRLVATAQPDGRRRVAEGSLRGDLYFTLAVVVVGVPPLRQRPEDIVPLFEQALVVASEKYGRPEPTLDDDQRAALQRHTWPGNLRELSNLAESTALLGPAGFSLGAGASGDGDIPDFNQGFKLADHLEAIERRILVEALRQADGDRNAAGRLLGVERNTLRYKLNKYGLLDP